MADFNPVSTANTIESAMPKLEKDPFLRLLLRSYAESTAERDAGIALLRSWTILELLADRVVTRGRPIRHPNGDVITNHKGNTKDTNAKEARVYQLILDSESFSAVVSTTVDGQSRQYLVGLDQSNPNYRPDSVLITLWDMVRAAYAIRNCVAHEGFFSEHSVNLSDTDQVLASNLISQTPCDPRRWIQDIAKGLLQKELNRSVPS